MNTTQANKTLKSIIDDQCQQGHDWLNKQSDEFKNAYKRVEQLKSIESTIMPSKIDGKKFFSKEQLAEIVKISEEIDSLCEKFDYEF